MTSSVMKSENVHMDVDSVKECIDNSMMEASALMQRCYGLKRHPALVQGMNRALTRALRDAETYDVNVQHEVAKLVRNVVASLHDYLAHESLGRAFSFQHYSQHMSEFLELLESDAKPRVCSECQRRVDASPDSPA